MRETEGTVITMEILQTGIVTGIKACTIDTEMTCMTIRRTIEGMVIIWDVMTPIMACLPHGACDLLLFFLPPPPLFFFLFFKFLSKLTL